MDRALKVIIVIVTFLVGLNGLMGGYAAISNPQAPFGISPDTLRNGPFDSFLIPGLVLFILIGGGNIAAGVVLLKGAAWRHYLIGSMGLASMGWIVIQCLIMGTVNALHIVIFIIGAAQALYALRLAMAADLFPGTIVNRFLGARNRQKRA